MYHTHTLVCTKSRCDNGQESTLCAQENNAQIDSPLPDRYHIDSEKKRGQRYIIAADTDDENVAETGIEVRWLRAELRRFLSRRKVLILGTCHSQRQGSKSQKVRGQKGALTGVLAPRSTTMLILNAASYRYAAYESKKLRADVYTHFLLDCVYALKRKRGHGGRVSAIEAHECSVKKTYRYVYRSRKAYQLPGLVSDVRGLNAVYFFGQPAPLLDQKDTGAAQRQGLVSKGGRRAIIQLPAELLKRYRLQIFRRKGKIDSLVETYTHHGEMVVTLAPGRYRFRFAKRHSNDHAEQMLDLGATDRLMLSPPRQFEHIFSISGGATQLGAPPLRTLHPYLALGYHLRPLPWAFVGVGVGWAIGQQPDGPAQFDLHRFALLRLEGGFVLWSQERINLTLGCYGLLGADLSYHPPTGRSSFSPAGGLGFDKGWTVGVDPCGFVWFGGQVMPGGGFGGVKNNPYDQGIMYLAQLDRLGKATWVWMPSALPALNKSSFSVLFQLIIQPDRLFLVGQFLKELYLPKDHRLPAAQPGIESQGFDIFAATLSLTTPRAQSADFGAAHGFGSATMDFPLWMQLDQAGRSHLLGSFRGPTMVIPAAGGSLPLRGTTDRNKSFYIRGENGVYSHGRTFGDVEVLDLFLDAKDTLYMVGSFAQDETLESCSFALNTSQQSSFFMARFAHGQTSSEVPCQEIVLHSGEISQGRLFRAQFVGNDQVALVGSLQGKLTFAGGISLESKGPQPDLFVLLYDLSQKKAIWVGSISGDTALTVPAALAIGPDGAVYVGGSFASQITCQGGGTTQTLRSFDDNGDGFLAKWSRDGRFLWALGTGGVGSPKPEERGGYVAAIAVSTKGHLYATGWVHGAAKLAIAWDQKTPLTKVIQPTPQSGEFTVKGLTAAFLWKVPNR